MQRPEDDTAPSAEAQEEFTGWETYGDEARAERAEGVPSGEGAASDAGALSVTRPPENTEPITPSPSHIPSLPQVLLTGTDTLDAGLYIEFPDTFPRLVRTLSKWKRAASGTKGYVAGNGRCIVHPGGKTNYPFLLQYPGFVLYLSRHIRPFGETPNAKLILGSQLLWERGERSAFDHAISELQALTDAVPSEVRFSRADITADLLIPGLGRALRRTLASRDPLRDSQCPAIHRRLGPSLEGHGFHMEGEHMETQSTLKMDSQRLRRDFLWSCGFLHADRRAVAGTRDDYRCRSASGMRSVESDRGSQFLSKRETATAHRAGAR